MKNLVLFVIMLLSAAAISQIKPVMTADGFAPIEFPRPNQPLEKLIDLAKAWAPFYNKDGYDVYNVTENSVTIDAFKDNAFYYNNLGETFQHRIRYALKVDFTATTCIMTFSVRDIYANNTLTKLTIASFFAPDGRLKEDYEEVRPSLEKTAQNVMRSFAGFITE